VKKFLLLFVCLALITPQFAYAEDATRYVVTYEKNTNLREKPSLDGKLIESVPPGKEYEIVSETKDNQNKLWYGIAYSPDKTAFVASWVVNVKTSEPTKQIEGQKAIIDPGRYKINIRALPNRDSEIVATLTERVTVPVLQKQPGDEVWYQIELGDDKKGWVLSSLISSIVSESVEAEEVAGMTAYIPPQVNIRELPTTDSPVVTKTTNPMQPPVTKKTSDGDGFTWYEVTLPTGKSGWVRSDMAKINHQEKETEVDDIFVVVNANTNIRKDAGVQFTEGTIKAKSQQQYKVLAKKPDINGDIWYKINTEFGEGWVFSKIVETIVATEFNTVKGGAILKLAPSSGSKTLFKIEGNTRCSISGGAENVEKEVWYLLTTSDNKTGWARSDSIILAKTFSIPNTNMLGGDVNILKRTVLAEFPSGTKGKELNPDAKGKVDTVAVRDGGTVYYKITVGKDIGWIPQEVTKRLYEQPPASPVGIGDVSWQKRNDVLEFRFPITRKTEVKIANYRDDPRINIYIQNADYISTNYTKDIDSSLVSRVVFNQKHTPRDLIITIKLNKAADYHLYPITSTSKEIRLDVFEYKSSNEPKVFIQGSPIHFTSPPTTDNGTILIPLDALGNELGVSPKKLDDGRFEFETDSIKLTFTPNNSLGHFEQPDGFNGDFTIDPAPRYVGDGDGIFFVPLNQTIALHLGFSYSYFPTINSSYLDPIIEKLEIGDCGETSSSCSALTTNMALLTDYEEEELSDGRVKISLFNSILDSMATKNLDKENVLTEFEDRKVDKPPVVRLYIKKGENQRLSIGEARNPNRLIITLREKVFHGLSGKTILIDPGHGRMISADNYDMGCVTESGKSEAKFALLVARQLMLELQEKGAKVVLTRNSDDSPNNPDLDERVSNANSGGYHMFVSLHFGFSKDISTQGTQTYCYTSSGKKLAQLLQGPVSRATGFSSKGVKHSNHYLCKMITGIPSVLIEPLYLSNKDGEDWISKPANVEALAESISDGISEYFEEAP